MVHAKSFQSFYVLDHFLRQIKDNVISDVVDRLEYSQKALEKEMYEDPGISLCGDAVSGIILLLINKMLGPGKTESKTEIKSAKLETCETAVFERFRNFVMLHLIGKGSKRQPLKKTCTGRVGGSLENFNTALNNRFVVEIRGQKSDCTELKKAMKAVESSVEAIDSEDIDLGMKGTTEKEKS
jgi:hypothetical protein